eukprot:6202799-Pleurochrysis_carterae.AAC.3
MRSRLFSSLDFSVLDVLPMRAANVRRQPVAYIGSGYYLQACGRDFLYVKASTSKHGRPGLRLPAQSILPSSFQSMRSSKRPPRSLLRVLCVRRPCNKLHPSIAATTTVTAALGLGRFGWCDQRRRLLDACVESTTTLRRFAFPPKPYEIRPLAPF